jgi:amino acid transporter
MGSFILASAVSALAIFLLSFGWRAYLTFQRIVAIFVGLATIAVIALLASSIGNFPNLFNSWATANHAINGTNPYQTVIQTAASQGFTNPAPTWLATLALVPVMWGAVNGSIWSNWVSGEMKNARSAKSQMLAMLGSAILSGVVVFALAAVLLAAVGYQFFASVVLSSWSFPAISGSYDFFIRILTPYIPIIDVAFILTSFLYIPMDGFFATRSMFAWSFDRIVPQKLASVSDRFHSPLFSLVVALILAEGLIYAFSFTYAPGLYAAVSFGFSLSLMINSIAVAAYPYVRRSQFETSPVNYRFLGIPLMTWAGSLSTLFILIMAYYYVAFPVLGGFSLTTLYSIVILLIASVAIFYAAKTYNKSRHGIDISMAFREIPPE